MEAGKQSMDGCAAACHVAYALRCATVSCCCEFGGCLLFVILMLMCARLLYSLVGKESIFAIINSVDCRYSLY